MRDAQVDVVDPEAIVKVATEAIVRVVTDAVMLVVRVRRVGRRESSRLLSVVGLAEVAVLLHHLRMFDGVLCSLVGYEWHLQQHHDTDPGTCSNHTGPPDLS